jgi:hypothetical protein
MLSVKYFDIISSEGNKRVCVPIHHLIRIEAFEDGTEGLLSIIFQNPQQESNFTVSVKTKKGAEHSLFAWIENVLGGDSSPVKLIPTMPDVTNIYF